MHADSNGITVTHVVASVAEGASGPSYSVPRLCEALAAGDIHVQLFSVGEGPQEQLKGYRHSQFRQNWKAVPLLSQLRASRSLQSALQLAGENSDIIHAHGLWLMPNIYPASVAMVTGRPLVVSPRGMLSSAALEFSQIRKRVFWWALQESALREASCLHASSEQEYNDIRRAGLRQPVAIIPNGIDIPPKPEGNKSTNDYRTLLFLGRLHPIKGLEGLVAAWALIENAHSDWQLDIVGPVDNAYAQALRRTVQDKGIKRVRFIGQLYGAAKNQAYEAADLFVLPTLEDSFALVIAEALAHGVPVITTKGAPWQGLNTHGCGWWIDHGVDALKLALESAMSLERDGLARMGAAGRDWMQRDFSWGSIARTTASVYGYLAGRSEQPSCIIVD